MKTPHKLNNFTDDEIKSILSESRSFLEAIKKFGYESIATGHYKQVKKELERRNINKPEYRYYGDFQTKNKIPTNDLLVQNSLTNNRIIKERLISENIIEYKCSKCGNNGEWMDEKLILQLEHINGINNDNREENLTFLCPNCHSQTNTYCKSHKTKEIKSRTCKCGKTISSNAYACSECHHKDMRIVERPSYEHLIKEIKESSQNKVAKKYGVSWRTIRKWLLFYENSQIGGI